LSVVMAPGITFCTPKYARNSLWTPYQF